MSVAGIYTTKTDIPRKPHRCQTSCVYNENGICDDPFINHGNGDASCYRMPAKKVLEMLVPLTD